MPQNYDAFTEGTALGGMRTKNDIRILLCYLLKCLDVPFSKSDLNEALQTTALANFFEINDALSSLTQSGLAAAEERDGDEYYTLTNAGKTVADRLETELPKLVRDTAVSAAMELLSKEKARGGTDVRIEKLPKGYHVYLSVKDGDVLMMQTVLYAADSIQANSICERFLQAPEKLYAGIVEILTR